MRNSGRPQNGDKLADRHGNKGVIAEVDAESMPYGVDLETGSHLVFDCVRSATSEINRHVMGAAMERHTAVSLMQQLSGGRRRGERHIPLRHRSLGGEAGSTGVGSRCVVGDLALDDLKVSVERRGKAWVYDGIPGDCIGLHEWGMMQIMLLNHLASDVQQWSHNREEGMAPGRGRVAGEVLNQPA